MDKYITVETAVKTAWMILEGLGFSMENNPELEKTVSAVFDSAPAVYVVEEPRCENCQFRGNETHFCSNSGMCVPKDGFCAAWRQRRADNGD